MKRTGGIGKSQATIKSSDLQESIKDAMDRVQFMGERLIVLRYGKPAAVLAPLSAADLAKLEGSAA